MDTKREKQWWEKWGDWDCPTYTMDAMYKIGN